MIKKIFFICAALASFQAHACSAYVNSSSGEVWSALDNNVWGFKNYNVVCEKLHKADAALLVYGHATVLGGKSISWAAVSLKDKNLEIYSNRHVGVSTKLSDNASIDAARSLLMESLNEAVSSIDIDKAIDALDESRKQIKNNYSR